MLEAFVALNRCAVKEGCFWQLVTRSREHTRARTHPRIQRETVMASEVYGRCSGWTNELFLFMDALNESELR